MVAGGWGPLVTAADTVLLPCTGGQTQLQVVELEGPQLAPLPGRLDSTVLAVTYELTAGAILIRPNEPLILDPGQEITFFE